MRFVPNDENDVCRDLVRALIALLLESDFGARLPARLDVDGEHLVLLLGGAVRLQHPPRDLHLLGGALGDLLQGHVEVVLDRRVLLLVFAHAHAAAGAAAVDVERLRAVSVAARPTEAAQVRERVVHVHVVLPAVVTASKI